MSGHINKKCPNFSLINSLFRQSFIISDRVIVDFIDTFDQIGDECEQNFQELHIAVIKFNTQVASNISNEMLNHSKIKGKIPLS